MTDTAAPTTTSSSRRSRDDAQTYDDIDVRTDGPITTWTIKREESGNKFRRQTAVELADALRKFRDDPDARVGVLTGTGTRFFCIGGEHEPVESFRPGTALPIVDVYELLDTIPKPIIAAVNGFAVGGGHVLHVVSDITIASDSAVFRQVGPMVGSFDAGYGTWLLEDAIGRKRAKEMWYLNRKYTAAEALAWGLVNEVVPGTQLMERVYEVAGEIAQRSPLALAGLKGAFSARHTGVAGQARLAHDQLLTLYLASDEAKEVSSAFAERRSPNTGQFYR